MRIFTAVCVLIGGVVLFGTITTATESTLQIHKTILENGLTILIREDHSAPVVSAQAWCRAGSITEGKYMGAGISHVLEHMLFKGTTTRAVGDIPHAVQRAGGDMNAYTSFEQTVYHIDLPAGNWQTAVDILADCMMNATIPTDELLKEKQVILREMAMGVDDPGRRADRLQWNTAFIAHPYRHPVIGYPDIYNRITRDEVVSYYRKYYVPNNLIFVIVGDINAIAVELRLRELTQDFKMNAVEPVTIPVEPPQVSLRERHEDAPVQLTHLDLAWHVPAATDPDVPALDVLSIIAGQGRSSRLYREIQQVQGLVHSIGAGNYTPGCPGLFGVGAITNPDKRDAAITAIRAEIRKFQTQLVTDDECRKAIKLSLSSHYERLKTMAGQAADIGSNELLVGDPNYSEAYLTAIRQVTPVDIQRVAKKHLTDKNLTITSLDPTGTNTKSEVATIKQAGIDIQKFDLPNGLRLLVREDHKLPFVDLGVFCKGGVLAETAGNNGITKLMSRMLIKGTPTRTAEQIADSVELVGGAINAFSGNNSFGVTAHAMSDDFDLVLDVLADVIVNPTFPDDKLARECDVQLAEVKAEQDQVLRSCQQLLRETIYTRHPYRLNMLGTPATVAKLTRADLADFHRRYIVPNNMVGTVVDNVKAGVAPPELEPAKPLADATDTAVTVPVPEVLVANFT